MSEHLLDMADLVSKATTFDFGLLHGFPEHWLNHVRVEQRNPGTWAVVWASAVWEDTEDYRGFITEPRPSSRTDSFVAATRFPLHRAVQIASALVDGTLKSQNEDVLSRHREEPV